VIGSQPAAAGETRPGGHGELLLRVASAVVLVPLALLTAYLGGPWFIALWALAAAGIAWEWTRLVGAWRLTMVPCALGLAAAGWFLAQERRGIAVAALAAGAVAAGIVAPAGRRLWTAGGAAYAAAMLAAPAVLRSDTKYGLVAIVFLFAVVWLTDIAAYFVGKLVGGPKLWPAVSPKKTWSGAIGGMAAGVAAGLVVAAVWGLEDLVAIGAVGVCLSVVAQAGDFCESALKRRFGAKDASQLIPGHGGLMDRLDGFWAAAVTGTMLGLARGGIHAPSQGLLVW
jgi:phosphatidate cytidylyltransferase